MGFPAGFCITSVKGEKNSFGLIFTPEGMNAAGVFTTNSCAAHPVEFSREKISNPIHRAILVNKGSANAATGTEGRVRLEKLVSKLARGLGIPEESVLVASTGVIGRQMEYSDAEIDRLIANKDRVEPDSFAAAIMTTDTCKKVVTETFEIDGEKVLITGIAKGSGMIAPDLATMLAFILTDLRIEKESLEYALKKVVAVSFNCLNIDGDTSTNDSVFLAASGTAGNNTVAPSGENSEKFYEVLKRVCISLVEKLAADGEGATKFIRINIHGAPDEVTAKKAAKAISSSPLCKTAFYGASPNWGRIVSALGAAGVKFNMEDFSLHVNGVPWVKEGVPQEETSRQVEKVLKKGQYGIDVHLNSGDKTAVSYTCDFSPEYVKINAGYLS